jgi:hypothetical protein
MLADKPKRGIIVTSRGLPYSFSRFKYATQTLSFSSSSRRLIVFKALIKRGMYKVKINPIHGKNLNKASARSVTTQKSCFLDSRQTFQLLHVLSQHLQDPADMPYTLSIKSCYLESS